jgi:hypothetical protein
LRVLKSKRGEFTHAAFEDMSGSIDMIVFPEAHRRLWKSEARGSGAGESWRASGEGSNRRSPADIIPLEGAKVPTPRAAHSYLVEGSTETTVDALHSLFTDRKGEARVLFDVERAGEFMVVMEAEGYNVHPDRNFIARVEELCGRGSVRVIN